MRAKLQKQFGFTNPHQMPRLEKIVLNVGLGEAIKKPKLLEAVVEELATITGQRPVDTRPRSRSRTSGSARAGDRVRR